MSCRTVRQARLVPALILLALQCCVLGACSVNPATGRAQLILISPQELKAVGEAAAPEVTREHGGEIDSPQLRAYVHRVGQQITARIEPEYRSFFDWSFTVVDDGTVNAFALPGGKIFVTRGLLQRVSDEAQLAAVLGHDIGHVTARHVDERLTQAVLAQLGLSYIGDATESQLVLLVVSLAAEGTLLAFSREQELEADAQGIRYMVAADYDPQAMLGLVEILIEASAGPRPPELLSTHPDPRTRLRAAQRLLDGPYRHTQGNPQFATHRDRFEREAGPYLSPRRR
ncbi:MAG: M48 family metalloprotease [Planctomycetota bacterium]|jgi:predicted Zn-dependent protease